MAKMRKENTRSITQLFGLVTYFTEFQTFQAELTSPVFSKLFKNLLSQSNTATELSVQLQAQPQPSRLPLAGVVW
jgi:hypothetical protein